MKKIDAEAHFYTQEYQEYLRVKGIEIRRVPGTFERLVDLAEGRLRDMDEAGIDMQVLSLSVPGCEELTPAEGTALANKTNDELAKVVKRYPDRFIGLAALAPQSPNEAADELERAVQELGLKGVRMHSHTGDTYLDDKRYWVIFDKAEKLGVPIYLHPTIPHPAMFKAYWDDYGESLAGAALGFGAETALYAMRLMYSGVFDKYPDLKVILGHLGEGLIFWMTRIDFAFKKAWMEEERPKTKKPPSEYIRNNFFVTTSGMFAVPAFMCVFQEIGADRMMFAVDYPYEETEEAVHFIEQVPISDIDKEKVQHLTAEKVFKLV